MATEIYTQSIQNINRQIVWCGLPMLAQGAAIARSILMYTRQKRLVDPSGCEFGCKFDQIHG